MREIGILCYHHILESNLDVNNTCISKNEFEKQIKYLKNNYDVISLDALDEELKKDGKPAIAITVDDGCKDFYLFGFPIIEKYRVPVTVFISTDNVGKDKENWMDAIIQCIFSPVYPYNTFELDDDFISCKWNWISFEEKLLFYHSINRLFRFCGKARREKYLHRLLEISGITYHSCSNKNVFNREEILELYNSELISIGAHTVTHPSLCNISCCEAEIEIRESIEDLERITGSNITLFAYPFGSKHDYSEKTIEILKENGIKYAFTTGGSALLETDNPYELPRRAVYNCDFDNYKLLVDGMFRTTSKSQIENSDSKTEAAIHYIGGFANDKLINSDCDSNMKFIICGCGIYGQKLHDKLDRIGKGDNIIAYLDNDNTKTGICVKNRIVISSKELKDISAEYNIELLVYGTYSTEIITDLLRLGYKNIRMYI